MMPTRLVLLVTAVLSALAARGILSSLILSLPVAITLLIAPVLSVCLALAPIILSAAARIRVGILGFEPAFTLLAVST